MQSPLNDLRNCTDPPIAAPRQKYSFNRGYAALTAASRLCVNASFGVSVKKIVAHATGLMAARTVTIA